MSGDEAYFSARRKFQPRETSTVRRPTIEARRQHIVSAAAEWLVAHPSQPMSMSDAISVAGGSLSTIYSLFGSRLGLMEAVMNHLSLQFATSMDARAVDALEPLAQLKETARHLVTLHRSPTMAAVLNLVFTEGRHNPVFARMILARTLDAGRDAVRACLDEQVAMGRLAVADTARAAAQFCSLVAADHLIRNACGMLQAVPQDELDGLVEEAVQAFVKAYGRSPS
jgi:TetR/AcrR family transcriptional repressor of cmeABC operon